MYIVKNILDSDQKKKITELLTLDKTVKCLSEYERLRIESFKEKSEFNLDEWIKTRDYLYYLFYNTMHLHDYDDFNVVDVKILKIVYAKLAEFAKSKKKTRDLKYKSEQQSCYNYIACLFESVMDDLNPVSVSHVIKKDAKKKFLDNWFNALNPLSARMLLTVATLYSERALFVYNRFISCVMKLFEQKIIYPEEITNPPDMQWDVKLEYAQSIEWAYKKDVKESIPYYAMHIINKDKDQAINILEQSANDGNDLAYYFLYKLFDEGKFVETNYKKSFNYLKCSGELGNVKSLVELIRFYEEVINNESKKKKPDNKEIDRCRQKKTHYIELLVKHEKIGSEGKLSLAFEFLFFSENPSHIHLVLDLFYKSALQGSTYALLIVSKLYATNKIEIKSKRLKSLCDDFINGKDINKNNHDMFVYPSISTIDDEFFDDDVKAILSLISEKIDQSSYKSENNIVFFPKKYEQSKHLSPIYNFIESGESEIVEFKSSLSWNYKENRKDKFLPFSVIKTVAAFLNTNGGNLLIGVKENDETNKTEIIGLKNDYSILQKKNNDGFEILLSDYLRNSLSSMVDIKNNIRITFENIDDVEVCIVNVSKSSEPVYVNFKSDKKEYKGAFFRREGRSTFELNAEEVVKYLNSRVF